MTAAAPEENQKKRRRMSKTVKPKSVTIDGKAYLKCPYPDCGYMARDLGFSPETGMRAVMLPSKNDIWGHIKDVHKLVWMRAGKTAGWYPLSKFHARPEVGEK